MSSFEGKNYWLISAPKVKEDPFSALDKVTVHEQDLSVNYKFHVPELRAGTLDSLMSLSDDLYKIDIYVENVTRKIANQLFDILPEKEENKYQSLTVNNNAVDTYLTFFRWDEAKYSIGQNLKSLVDLIQSQVAKLEEELRIKTTEYGSISMALGQQERAISGSLLIKELSDVIKVEHMIDSEYLQSVFVAVPKYLVKDWNSQYERLSTHIVPRSSESVAEDSEYILFKVVLFKKMLDDFKNAAREKKFVVRDFIFDPQKSGSANKKKLEEEKDKLKKNLVRWCKTNFSEAFIAWIHLKAIRIFVESVLRYGLPSNFQAVLILPLKKSANKLRTILNKLFAHASSEKLADGKQKDDEDTVAASSALGGNNEKFYPYVYTEISLDFGSKI